MDRLALVRGLHHPMRNHNSAAAEALTGRTPAGGDQELLTDDPRGMPTLGSAVSYALGSRADVLPYVALPYTLYNVVQLPGQTPGLLGGALRPLPGGRRPERPDFRIAAFDGTADLAGRAALLRGLDRVRAARPGRARRGQPRPRLAAARLARGAPPVRPVEGAAARARPLRPAPARPEPAARPAAGRGRASTSSPSSTARRNGQDANWDSHEKLFPRHRQLIPPADQALSALIEDLEPRGLLDSTLVVAMGEFGRTPKINGSAGRDHWPDCYTAVLAGGGVTRRRGVRGERPDRRVPGDRPGDAGRPGGDDLLAVRHRPRDRGARPDRPPVPPRRGRADPPAVLVGGRVRPGVSPLVAGFHLRPLCGREVGESSGRVRGCIGFRYDTLYEISIPSR